MVCTEQNVTEQLLKKNPEALDFVMNTYGSTIYWLVFRILQGVGKEEDIEECVSDVYVKLWHNSCDYDSKKGSLRTWLLLKAKYTALDYRRRLLRATEPLNGAGGLAENFAGTEDSNGSDLADILVSEELKKDLVRAIAGLKVPERQMVVMRYFYYHSIEEIATRYGLTRSAVENRLWRARKTLRELLRLEGKEGLL